MSVPTTTATSASTYSTTAACLPTALFYSVRRSGARSANRQHTVACANRLYPWRRPLMHTGPGLAHRGPHLELYIRRMQEIRRFKPSTTSRRFSVTAGFYRTCVIDGLMQHSPAEHVRRPAVPAESPTLGFTHLQFRGAAHCRPGITQPLRLRPGGHARPARVADLRSQHRRPGRRTRPPGTARMRQGQQSCPGPAAASGRPGDRPGYRPARNVIYQACIWHQNPYTARCSPMSAGMQSTNRSA